MNAITPAEMQLSETLDSNDFVDVSNAKVPAAIHAASECCCIAEAAYTNIKPGRGGYRENAGRPPGSLNAMPAQGRKPKPASPPAAPIGTRWYVAETHPHTERQVAVDLTRQGWMTYLPLTAIWRRDRVLPTMVHKDVVPLIRGVVFVEFDRDEQTWGTIREYCSGVRDILRGPGGRPAPLLGNDLHRLDQIRSGDAERLKLASVVTNPSRAAGDVVRVVDGPFAGFAAVVQSCNGLATTVVVEIFGRETAVEMTWGMVE